MGKFSTLCTDYKWVSPVLYNTCITSHSTGPSMLSLPLYKLQQVSHLYNGCIISHLYYTTQVPGCHTVLDPVCLQSMLSLPLYKLQQVSHLYNGCIISHLYYTTPVLHHTCTRLSHSTGPSLPAVHALTPPVQATAGVPGGPEDTEPPTVAVVSQRGVWQGSQTLGSRYVTLNCIYIHSESRFWQWFPRQGCGRAVKLSGACMLH